MRVPRLLRVGRTLMKGTFRWISSTTKREALVVRIAVPTVLYAGTWVACDTPGNRDNCDVWDIEHALTDQYGPDVLILLALIVGTLLGLGMLWACSGWKRRLMRKYVHQGMELANDIGTLLVGCSLAIAMVNSVFSFFIIWSWGLALLMLVLWFTMVFMVRLPLVVTIKGPIDAWVGRLIGLGIFLGIMYGERFVVMLVHGGH